MTDQGSQGVFPAQIDPTFADWARLDWRERRERRLERWLSAPGVDFHSEEARQSYQQRVQLIIDALLLTKPARVPVAPSMGLYTARYSGLTVKEAMYDYEKSAAALVKFHEDFMPDFQADAPIPAKVFDLLGLEFVNWPGHGVEDDTPWQYRETEYMMADEYDALIADPSGYFLRSFLPRIGSTFAPLSGLDPFVDMTDAYSIPFSILPFADPSVVQAAQRIANAANETLAYLEAMEGAAADAAGRLGIPSLEGGVIKAPYDVIADTLRGTKGIVMDRFRQPGKIIEAAERLAPLQMSMGVRQAAMADSPLVMLVLHKGADGFMSDADFRAFYWPTLKTVTKGLVDEGIVPLLFAEGGYNQRLQAIADDGLPDGSVIWLFDQTDMVKAKHVLGGHACIMGNVPNSLLALGTAEEVEQYVTRLLDACAGDGGFILASGAIVDDAKPETLRAMIETGRSWAG